MLKRGSIIYLILAVGLTGAVYLVFLMTPEPPSEAMEKARKVIAEARRLGAEKYAPEVFVLSEQAYDEAVRLLEQENKRFILARNYDAAGFHCKQAVSLAEQAKTRSMANSRSLEVSVKARIEELQGLTERYSQWMNAIPVKESTRKAFLNGKMWLSEASIDLEKKRYKESDEKVKKATQQLNASIAELNGFLDGYFHNYPDWITWYQESLEKSRKTGGTLIVVDKMARSCVLYKNGKAKKSYPIELGRNWIGDKRFGGDKSTPEGRYHVVKKMENGNTKYYKALLINYPNEDDKQRFSSAKRGGVIPPDARIGGLIEIHGHGGKGADWTDGCIALADEDMKDLFSHATVTTPVTIVGSLVPWKKLLNEQQ